MKKAIEKLANQVIGSECIKYFIFTDKKHMYRPRNEKWKSLNFMNPAADDEKNTGQFFNLLQIVIYLNKIL